MEELNWNNEFIKALLIYIVLELDEMNWFAC